MYEDEDFPRDDSYWQYRCSESEELVSELVEWIESIEDDVSRSENMKNVSNQKTNTSGVRGVGFDKARNKWSARIEVDRKIYHLGRYDTFEEAVAERRAAEFEYGFHENHGA